MMRWLLVSLLFLPAPGGAQPLLDFRNDLAFKAEVVEGVAGKAYARRLSLLEAEAKLDNKIRITRKPLSYTENWPNFWDGFFCRPFFGW